MHRSITLIHPFISLMHRFIILIHHIIFYGAVVILAKSLDYSFYNKVNLDIIFIYQICY